MKSNKLYLPHRTWIHRPYDPHKRPKYHTDKAHLSQNTWICTRCSTLQNCWIWTRNPTSLLHPKAPNFQSLYSTLHHSPTPRHLQLTSETLKLCFCCLWAPQRGTRRPNRTKRNTPMGGSNGVKEWSLVHCSSDPFDKVAHTIE